MLRCHFDLVNPKQDGPLYHLQIGGNPRAEEYCWYPKEFDLPRLIHQPLDTVLLCQLVIANYFPADYQEIRRDINWRWAVKSVERYLRFILPALLCSPPPKIKPRIPQHIPFSPKSCYNHKALIL